MNIFWRDEHPPALQGLDWHQRQAAEGKALSKACRHWQVWLPFAAVAVLFPAAVMIAPVFPFRLSVDLIVLGFAVRTAAIPLHNYVQRYLAVPKQEVFANDDCTSMESAFAAR